MFKIENSLFLSPRVSLLTIIEVLLFGSGCGCLLEKKQIKKPEAIDRSFFSQSGSISILFGQVHFYAQLVLIFFIEQRKLGGETLKLALFFK